jgi:hypothetical protein
MAIGRARGDGPAVCAQAPKLIVYEYVSNYYMENKDQLQKINKWKDFLNKLDMPENMPDYASQAYWDSRYELEKDHYDWYVDFEQLKVRTQ